MIEVDAGPLRATGRFRVAISRAALDEAPELRRALEAILGRDLAHGPLHADLEPEPLAAVRDCVQAHVAGGSLAPHSVPFHCFEAIRELVRSGQLVLALEIAPIRSGSNAILRALLHNPQVTAVAKNLSRRFVAGSDRFWGALLAEYVAHRHQPAPVRIVYKDHWIAVPPLLEAQLLEVAGDIFCVLRDPVKVAFSIADTFTSADDLLASVLAPRLEEGRSGVEPFLAAYARQAGFADWSALRQHATNQRDYRPLDALFSRIGLDDDPACARADDETGDELVRRHPAAFLDTWRQLARLATAHPAAAVVDMTRLQLAPAPTLQRLCEKLGMTYVDAMRDGWRTPLPQPAVKDAVLTRAVDASTGIRPPAQPTPPFDHLPASLRGFVERALAVYLELLDRARTPADDAAMEDCLRSDPAVVRSNPLPFYAHVSTSAPDGERSAALGELRRERPDLVPLFDRIDVWRC